MKTATKFLLCVISLLVVFSFSAYSQQIYRWVDEKGYIHYSTRYDRIPDKYRNQVSKPPGKAEREQNVITSSESEQLTDKSPFDSSKEVSPVDQPTHKGKNTGRFILKSPAFPGGGKIPTKYTRRGADISPPLVWENPPSGTKCYVLTVNDPDSPWGKFIHWIIFNIPGNQTSLPEGIPKQRKLANGIKQGVNDWLTYGYGGPDPPDEVHRYVFTLTALDVERIRWPRTRTIEKHALGETTLIGLYP
jgi:Raf kinase inhibitor-like YbhB/YbcL family protein